MKRKSAKEWLAKIPTVMGWMGWFGFFSINAYTSESQLARMIWILVMLVVPALLYWWLRESSPWPVSAGPISDWYKIWYDQTAISLKCNPEEGKKWSRDISWVSITHVRYIMRGLMSSDELWLYGQENPKKPFIRIPTEADGGAELSSEFVKRGFVKLDDIVGPLDKNQSLGKTLPD
jgi:hypothetical protein